MALQGIHLLVNGPRVQSYGIMVQLHKQCFESSVSLRLDLITAKIRRREPGASQSVEGPSYGLGQVRK
jgi:hypothetical protein